MLPPAREHYSSGAVEKLKYSNLLPILFLLLLFTLFLSPLLCEAAF